MPSLMFALWLVDPALGCSCVSGLIAVSPEPAAVGVPLDARVLLEYNVPNPHENVTLWEAETGLIVPVTVDERVLGDITWRLVVPEVELSPGTTYEYAVDDLFGVGGEQQLTTGSEVAPPPPASHIDDVLVFGPEGMCGSGWRFLVELRAGEPHDGWWELEVARSEDFSDAEVIWSASRDVGAGDYGCDANLPDLQRGDRLFVRGRTVALSGEPGSWSDTERVRLVEPLFGGCQTASHPTSVWPLLLWVPWVLVAFRSTAATSSTTPASCG